MRTYYEQQMEIIDRKLAVLKQQINTHKIIIEKNKGQIVSLKAQIEHFKQIRENLIKKYVRRD